jgi:LDH2 family malate/lactate/ureidoglycolate dehydrogenase
MEAATAGRPLPAGIAQDASGSPTTDPQAVLSGGALLSFDRSHKGSALGLIVELLAGPLAGAAVADKAASRDWGNLVVAVDPELLGSAAEFRVRVGDVLRRVKDARRQPGAAQRWCSVRQHQVQHLRVAPALACRVLRQRAAAQACRRSCCRASAATGCPRRA